MVSCHDKYRILTYCAGDSKQKLKSILGGRCKIVADDRSESHFQWHGLVHFPKRKLQSWKKQAYRTNVGIASSKNTFKKIICLDHAVGVLRYLSCEDGKRIGRRNGDCLVTHTHHSRQPIDEYHKRVKQCSEIRNQISENLSSFVPLENKPKHNLHDTKTCLCDRGDVGKEKRYNADEKRRAFYI